MENKSRRTLKGTKIIYIGLFIFHIITYRISIIIWLGHPTAQYHDWCWLRNQSNDVFMLLESSLTRQFIIIGITVKVNEVWYWDDGAIYKVDPGKITIVVIVYARDGTRIGCGI